MESLKSRLEQIKNQLNQLLSKYEKKTLQKVFGVGAAIIIMAIIIAYIVNIGSYEVLFSAVPEQEAANITARLQSDGIDYQHTEAGDILVAKDIADQTRATLVVEGYPSSGFMYETYIENSGGMTTSSQEEEYKRIALEQKIEATISLFDGVNRAVVSIAIAENDKYVLQSDATENASSASVAVDLELGAKLSDAQIEGIQRLVAGSVQGLEMENVVVVDGSGIELSTNTSGASSDSESQDELKVMENALATKVANVLSPFYGAENIRVSVTGVLNQDKGISESIIYSIPEGLTVEDGKGILSNESGEVSLNGEGLVGGVAGTEANSEIPQYNVGEDGTLDSYDENYLRDYLVNQLTEQKEVHQNTLEDISISVSINSDSTTTTINENELLALIGNAAGIETAQRDERITVVSAPFYDASTGLVPSGVSALFSSLTVTQLIIIGVVALLIIVLVLLLVMSSRSKKKKKLLAEQEALAIISVSDEEAKAMQIEEINLMNEKSNEIRKNIREFADENPEISAQMIKSWLNGQM